MLFPLMEINHHHNSNEVSCPYIAFQV
jgi:hypothetical protein